eukprot:TRINITY_DN9297_c0_g3_i1.p1 TRINITY_DN9297_c0_g3~~TRINITY_DN9297_c0_g3_i1.p1  ORF type:complete len:223 (-),score=32.88 TRINITY_DN9297_c0_g3_i1:7-675(-)
MAETEDLLSTELSSNTLAALQEFLTQQKKPTDSDDDDPFVEDWGMSQFWYDEETSNALAKEVVEKSRSLAIACVACPSLFRELKQNFPDAAVHLLEYDRRFARFGTEFSFYDYNDPVSLPSTLAGQFEVVVADPPYLSEECLAKTAQTMRFLSRDADTCPLLLLTGAVQRQRASDYLKLRPCKFRPTFKNKLANEFLVFTSYEPSKSSSLGAWEDDLDNKTL